MQAVLAKQSVSVSELKKSPSDVISKLRGKPAAILSHNEVKAYIVPRAWYEAKMEQLEDAELLAIVKARKADGQKPIRVSLDDL